MSSTKKKLFLVVNVDWFFLSHRLPIALAANEKDYEVTVMAIEEAGKGDEIRSYGLNFIPLPATRSGTNPFKEIKVLRFLYKTYKKHKPDLVHHVAMKPIIYGSVAARLASVPKVINAISGLGYLHINAEENKNKSWLLRRMLNYGLKQKDLSFIVQNNDDKKYLLQNFPLKNQQIHLIKGSGVDLEKFSCTKEPDTENITILLAARMLKDKGVVEFVKAASSLKETHKNLSFILAGATDTENPSAISQSQLEQWHKEGIIKWIGHQENMKKILDQSHIVILPSYREGLPKSLIEACAVGRPIITTDVPGCREMIYNNTNGILVPVKNVPALVAAIKNLLNPDLRKTMGLAARKIAEQHFSITKVVTDHLKIYKI